MPRRGSREMRNAAHKARQAELLAAARTDAERLDVAFGWFRSSAALLARRRPPRGAGQEAHREAAVTLTREAAGYLAGLAQAIDRGDHDAKEVA